MGYNCEPLRPAHIISVAGRMRECDRKEIWLANHLRPVIALKKSLTSEGIAAAWIVNGTAEAVFGATTRCTLTRSGVPWMLATHEIYQHRKEFLRDSKRYIKALFTAFDYLENYVLAENKASVKWLKWCGFTIEEAAPYGIEKAMFNRFWWRKHNV